MITSSWRRERQITRHLQQLAEIRDQAGRRGAGGSKPTRSSSMNTTAPNSGRPVGDEAQVTLGDLAARVGGCDITVIGCLVLAHDVLPDAASDREADERR